MCSKIKTLKKKYISGDKSGVNIFSLYVSKEYTAHSRHISLILLKCVS